MDGQRDGDADGRGEYGIGAQRDGDDRGPDVDHQPGSGGTDGDGGDHRDGKRRDLTATFAPGGAVIIHGGTFAGGSTRVEHGAAWPNHRTACRVEVTDGGRTLAAPIGGVAAEWVTLQLPFGISTSVDVRVVTPASRSGARTISVAARNPRLYSPDASGTGPAWAYHTDGYELSASLPARRVGKRS